jgi:hypothetical protein
VIYGGASGSSLSFEDEELEEQGSAIKPLEIATNNVIIHDSDSEHGDTDMHHRIRRLRDELIRSEVKQTVLQTPGREIENLVEPDVLAAVVMELAPKHLKVNGRRIGLVYRAPVLGTGTAFDSAFSETVNATDGSDLEPMQRQRIRRTISGRKPTIARAVVARDGAFTNEAVEFGRTVAAKLRPSIYTPSRRK